MFALSRILKYIYINTKIFYTHKVRRLSLNSCRVDLSGADIHDQGPSATPGGAFHPQAHVLLLFQHHLHPQPVSQPAGQSSFFRVSLFLENKLLL